MKHSNKFVVFIICLVICSLFAFSYVKDDSSYIINQCGFHAFNDSDLENLIDTSFSSCEYFSNVLNESCSGGDALFLEDYVSKINFFFSVNVSEMPQDYDCQLIISEIGTNSIESIKINDYQLYHFNSRNFTLNEGCIEKVKYFNFNSSILNNGYDSFVRHDLKGNNLIEIQKQGESYLNRFKLVCTNDTKQRVDNFKTDLILDRDAYKENTLVTFDVFYNESLTNPNHYTFFKDLKYRLFLYNVNTTVVPHGNFYLPQGCSFQRAGQNTIITCSFDQLPQHFAIKFQPKVEGTYNYEGRVLMTHKEGENTTIPNVNIGQLIVSSEGITGEEIGVRLIELGMKDKRVNELSYMDRFDYAEIQCDTAYANDATLIIRNRNAKLHCTYSSNLNLGNGKFSIDLSRNYGIYDFGCNFPFAIDRSGLYDFQMICGGQGCSGPCYNPLPSPVPTIPSAWRNYFLPGRSFFSFYNENQVFDCVCNSNRQFVNITVYDEQKEINFEKHHTRDDIYLSIYDILNSTGQSIYGHGDDIDIEYEDYVDIEVIVGCFDANGCENLEVYLYSD